MFQNHAAFRVADFLSRSILPASRAFAFSNSAFRVTLSPLPPRLMKYVSIRMPDPGPFGETLFDARVRAITAAFLVNRPAGGWVESVFTFETQRFFLELVINSLLTAVHKMQLCLREEIRFRHAELFGPYYRWYPMPRCRKAYYV